jgi:prepilin-type N-terminal cleavage/methylation domain-containing protein
MKVLNKSGFTILELLITITVVVISLSLTLYWQKSSWKRNASANRLTVATQIIEKQIESRRLLIARDPEFYYSKFKSLSDTTIIDNSVSPNVSVKWTVKPEYDPKGVAIENVRRANLIASWGKEKGDSLSIVTCIGKNF